MITMIGLVTLVTAKPYFIVTSFWIFSLEQNHGVKKVFSNAYNYCIIIFRDKIVQIIMFMMLFCCL